jgi:hypothetical protein
MTIFSEAATIERCDFSAVRRDEIGHHHAAHLVPDYVVGVWEGLELYHARATARVFAGETDAAADDLSVCIKMIRHIGGDSVIASAVCGHAGFRRTVELCEDLLKRRDVSRDCESRLAEAYKLLSPADPFGYGRSVSETRKDLGAELARSVGGQLGDELSDSVNEVVRSWTGDQLVCGVMALDAMTAHLRAEPAGGTQTIEVSMRDRRARGFLGGTLGEEFLKEAEVNAALIATLLQDGDVGSVQTWPPFDRSPVEALRREARREFRKAQRVILAKPKEES